MRCFVRGSDGPRLSTCGTTMTRPREGECKAVAPVIGLITAGLAIFGGLIKFKKEVETGMDCLVFLGFGFVGFMYGGMGLYLDS